MLEPLTFDELVRIRAYRILNKLPLYQSCVDAEFDPRPIFMLSDDQLIGVYQNSPTDMHQNIFIAQNGIYFHKMSWEQLLYTDMVSEKVSVATPSDKRKADTLIVQKTDGEAIALRFASAKSEFADVWEVSRFFSRVIADSKRS